MEGSMSRFMVLSQWVYFLLIVQLLWFVGVIVGVFILGIIPSTYAVFTVVRKRLRDEDISINKEFWKHYKANLFTTQLKAYIWILLGIFIYYDIRILFSYQHIISLVLGTLLVSVLIIYVLSSMLLIPIQTNYNLSGLNQIRLAILISVTKPPISIGLTVITILLFLLVTYIPILFSLIGIGLSAILYTKCTLFALEKLEIIEFIKTQNKLI